MKKTWKGIRCIVNTKKTNLMNTSQIISNNKLINNPPHPTHLIISLRILVLTPKKQFPNLGNVLQHTSKTELTPTLL